MLHFRLALPLYAPARNHTCGSVWAVAQLLPVGSSAGLPGLGIWSSQFHQSAVHCSQGLLNGCSSLLKSKFVGKGVKMLIYSSLLDRNRYQAFMILQLTTLTIY